MNLLRWSEGQSVLLLPPLLLLLLLLLLLIIIIIIIIIIIAPQGLGIIVARAYVKISTYS